MFTTITTKNGTRYALESEYIGDRPAPWNTLGCYNTNNHVIEVENTDTGNTVEFDFWASIVDPEIHDEEGLLSAFTCIIQEAQMGSYGLEGIIEEIGYYYKGIIDDANASEETFHKLESIGITLDDVYELLETLEDYR